MSAQTIEENLKASTLVSVPEVTVCETTLSCKLTAEEYAKLEDYETEHDLIGLRVNLGRFQRDIKAVERNSTPPDYQALQEEIEDMEKALERKRKERQEGDPLKWTKADRKYMVDLDAAIKERYTELDAMELDEAAILKRTDAMMKDLQNFQRHQAQFYLEFVYDLAKSRGKTRAKLETWREKADEKDYKAANELVSKGKALWRSTGELRPLPPLTTSLKN